MRTYHIRRKDLSHVPFQYYVFADGRERPIDKGITSTFALTPPKGPYDVVHVQILAEFAQTLAERWDIAEADLVRVAAKALEVWVKGEPIPEDHYYGPDFLKIDKYWYPAAPDGTPLIALDPYNFSVVCDEAYASVDDWPFMQPSAPHAGQNDPGAPAPAESGAARQAVFGFTADVFPGPLIIGYHQFKNKIADAGIQATVRMLPLGDLPPGVDVLFVPRELAAAAALAAPHSRIEVLDTFQNHPVYNSLVEAWSRDGGPDTMPGSGLLSHAG